MKLLSNLSRQRYRRRKLRRLGTERLEQRQLLAVAVVETVFREEDFSISGNFSYTLTDSDGYRDSIPSGNFVSNGGHIQWTSPIDGNGFFEGSATGDGNDSFLAGGQRRDCSSYGIDDRGKINLTVDALDQTLRIEDNELYSTVYTYYVDHTDGNCPAPDPPWSRFFGGVTNLYVGTFDPATALATIEYQDNNPNLSISTQPAQVVWEENGQSDLALSVRAIPPDYEVPEGWVVLPQESEPPTEIDFIDLSLDLEIKVDVTGKPLPIVGDVEQPSAEIKLYWTQAANDAQREELAVNSPDAPLGVYWNSDMTTAVISDFPEPPSWANYVKVEVEGVANERDSGNNSVFLQIEEFEAENSISDVELTEDQVLQGLGSSILSLGDSLDDDIRVYAYNPKSRVGADVSVADDRGGFVYDPRFAEETQSLIPADDLVDGMDFIAIKYQTLYSAAVHLVPLQGLNDDPVATPDFYDTTSDTALTVFPQTNDSDIDRDDFVTLHAVGQTSTLGATLSLDATGEQITYDPANSEVLQSLAADEQRVDSFSYQIIDSYGAITSGQVEVTVTGVDAPDVPVVVTIGRQFTVLDVATDPIALELSHPTAPLDTITLSALSSRSDLIAPDQITFSGNGATRTLVATPAAGLTGVTQITVTATDGAGGTGTMQFELIVGTPQDQDLDGAPDAVEKSSPNDGDFNADGTPDWLQPNVASLFLPTTGTYVGLMADQPVHFEEFSSSPDSPADGVSGQADFPLGALRYVINMNASQLPTSGSEVDLTLWSDYQEKPLNAAFFADPSVIPPTWQRWADTGGDGARIYHDRIAISLSDNGRADGNPNSEIVQGVVAPASLLNPWHNAAVPYDVNGDGRVRPIDALIVINDLNRRGMRDVSNELSPEDELPGYLDVSGDLRLAPIDALIIVNFLNRQGNEGPTAGEGEGDSADHWDPMNEVWQGPTDDLMAGQPDWWLHALATSEDEQRLLRCAR